MAVPPEFPTSPPSPPISPALEQPKKHTRRNIMIIAVVVIVIGILIGASLLSYKPSDVYVTAINVIGQVNVLGTTLPISDTRSVDETLAESSTWSQSIPLNWPADEPCTLTIESLSSQTSDFTVSLNPAPPITLSSGGNITETITITTPSHSYNGPLTILMVASCS